MVNTTVAASLWARGRASLAVALVLAGPIVASADVVTLCGRDDQSGQGVNLAQALAIGGPVSFACAPGATIRMTRTHDISRNTVVDGGGDVTLDAEGRPLTMFRMAADDVELTLQNLTMRGARPVPVPTSPPGRVTLVDRGRFGSVVTTMSRVRLSIVLDNVTVRDSDSPIFIWARNADAPNSLVVRDCRFRNNGQSAVSVTGAGARAAITGSTFADNATALSVGGTATVVGSTITGSTNSAIRVYLAGDLDVRHSRFTANAGAYGGAIDVYGPARRAYLSSVTFTRNRATVAGGAVALRPMPVPAGQRPFRQGPTTFVLVNATLGSNRAPRGGGVDLEVEPADSVVIRHGLFNANQSDGGGGGAFIRGGRATVAGAIFVANQSGAEGGAAVLSGTAGAPIVLANGLIVRNGAASGGALVASDVQIRHVTLADNLGGGLGAYLPSGRIEVVNTLLTDNTPSNCMGALPNLVVRGRNLQSPSAQPCANVDEGDPMLDDFYAPVEWSPAARGGDPGVCADAPVSRRDVFSQGRKAECSLGAVEYGPLRAARSRFPRRRVPPR